MSYYRPLIRQGATRPIGACPLAGASILAKKEVSATHSDVNFQHYQNFNQIFGALLNDKTDVGVVLSPFYNAYKNIFI